MMKLTRKEQIKIGDSGVIPKRFCIPEHRGKGFTVLYVGGDSHFGKLLTLRFADGSTLDCTTLDISPVHFARP